MFARVRALHLSGRSASAIVRETGVGRRRVDKWIRCTQLPTRSEMEPKPTSPRFFASHLQRRWAEGCHEGPRLLTEIRALGYRGCYSSIAKFLARWRDHEPELQPKSRPPASVSLRQQAGGHPTVSGQISPLVAPALLSKPRPLLTGWQAAKVEALKKACPDFARMRSVVLSFRGILQCGKAATLARWMKKAVASGIYGMKRFVSPAPSSQSSAVARLPPRCRDGNTKRMPIPQGQTCFWNSPLCPLQNVNRSLPLPPLILPPRCRSSRTVHPLCRSPDTSQLGQRLRDRHATQSFSRLSSPTRRNPLAPASAVV